MSTLTQFSGGGIKSIQRGTISITSPNTTATATVTSVNTAKSLLTYLGQTGYYGGTGVDGISNVRIALTNSTTITATTFTIPNAGGLAVSYELVEYN
jgi:hypothetical protein